MLLSSRATRILEEVKNGCCMLYGAEYFTEDEWVKIDALLHKGKYVFTNGPQKQLQDAYEPSESQQLVRIEDKAVSEPPSSTQAGLQGYDGPSEDEPKSDALVTLTNKGHGNFSGSPSDATCFHCQARPQLPENETRAKLPKPKFDPSAAEFVRSYEPKKEESTQRVSTRASDEPRIILTRSMASSGTQSLPVGSRSKKPASGVQAGKSYKAIKDFQPPPEAPGGIPISCGDKIRVKKPIGTNLCLGLNTRTGLFGSFPVSAILEDDKTSSKKTDHGSPAVKKTGGFSMDDYDNRKTAEWEDEDEDDILPPPTEPQNTSNSVEGTNQIEGPDRSEPAASANSDREINSESDSESAGMESRVSSLNTDHDEEVANEQKPDDADYENKELQMTKYRPNRSYNSSPKPGKFMTTRDRLRIEPHEIVVPKTEVCYYWDSPKGCRFPEAQCRDLHEHREYTLQTNIRNGKINPGVLFDVVYAIPSPEPGKQHQPADPSTTVGKRFTCFFWHSHASSESTRKCLNSAAACQFLHTYVGSEGILYKEVQIQAFKNRNRKPVAKQPLSPPSEAADGQGWGSAEDASPALDW
ncbi:uncharacterized protein EAE98_002671 [Botrytis deweyae]|uniref:C3H1-type domain-containing protein n=1 Tax=Botrytis deweyae TaxID=2478750 RepID=A0ABQ7IUE7_9HELO|nr:uncharacterized protein EAE98_002671 [Botrytis deweyae]KAF7934626.1 hypothetical protein EAE98_002671 [Botrytis deweyae]